MGRCLFYGGILITIIAALTMGKIQSAGGRDVPQFTLEPEPVILAIARAESYAPEIGTAAYSDGLPGGAEEKSEAGHADNKVDVWKGVRDTYTVTGYNSVIWQTDSTPCIAASNKNICELFAKGINICASNDFKFGTKLLVEDLGECIVLDRMHGKYTGKKRIDWFFGYDVAQARWFGVQSKKVIIQ